MPEILMVAAIAFLAVTIVSPICERIYDFFECDLYIWWDKRKRQRH